MVVGDRHAQACTYDAHHALLPLQLVRRALGEHVVVCCWSAKGGAGTTVVAAALALLLARAAPGGALLVDLAGDATAVAGLPADPEIAGVSEWLREGPLVPADAMARLEVTVRDGLALLPRGDGPLSVERAPALIALLAADPRPVVVDAGVVAGAGDTVAAIVTAAAADSLLVTRPCFLAIRRALVAPVRPSGVVLVVEEGRALTASDIESALGVPVRAEVSVTAQVARAVDAGVFLTRLPRSLERELRHAA
jgi:MinD-like ATPase involved in chromosome partitioning or flagellar assembly